MIKLIYRALPFFIIIFFMYKGADWAQETYQHTREKITVEVTKFEMNSIQKRLDINLYLKPKNIYDFDTFMRKTYDEDQIEKLRTDGWGTEYLYEYSPIKKIYALTSAGPDKGFGTEDDIIITNRKQE